MTYTTDGTSGPAVGRFKGMPRGQFPTGCHLARPTVHPAQGVGMLFFPHCGPLVVQV